MKQASIATSHLILETIEAHGRISAPDLAEKLGKTIPTINFYIRIFQRAEPKQVYVAKIHETDGRGRCARLWAVGDLPDVELPIGIKQSHLTEAEQEAKWIAEDSRRRAALAQNVVRRDPFIAAFFGEFSRVYPPTLSENRCE